MIDIQDDRQAWPLLLHLSGCLEVELGKSGLGGQCFHGIIPGGTVAHDFCDCGQRCGGQAWVRLVNAYPSSDFPNLDTTARCGTKLAFRVEVGVVRCIPTMDEKGEPPTVEEQLEAARKQMADMQAMRRAIQCCMTSHSDSLQYVLEGYVPTENQGGCGGGMWTFTVRP